MDKSGLLTALRTLLTIAVCVLGPALFGDTPRGQALADARAPGQDLGQDTDLIEAIDAVNRARGPEAYAAIRELWSQWGTADPAAVEHALREVASSKQFEPAIRTYAGFLAAHARTRRGDVRGATQAIAGLGYVSDWLVVGPFDNEGKGGYDLEYGPEAQFAQAIAEERAYSGKERPVRWRRAPDAFPFGWLSGDSLFRPEQSICFYATTFVHNANAKPQRASVWAGVGGAFKLFINGVKVLEDSAYRGHDIERFGAKIELPPGTSRATLKACGTEDAPVVSLRFGAADGGSDVSFKTSATLADSNAAIANFEKLKVIQNGLGPISRFEKQTAGKKPSAANLEAYARYLVTTHGDDPTVHKARDLSKRAADDQPTLERLLLAGQLSEDYNSHRQWVEKAEALAEKRGQQSVDVILARATVERGGLNWRDAFPYYDQALALEPNNVEAIQGRVELFNEAGMNRTALSVLRQAVERRPKSVVLLSMYAAQLRNTGNVLQADETERRYSQFRFDDHNFITGKLDLALARNEAATATHWVERLVELNPDSLWARGVAARTYRRLKQPERAISAFNFALSLAPEDVGTMRALSDMQGEQGNKDEQLRLLRRILEIRPQAKDVAEYLQHVEPDEPKQDEAYAWSADRFLKDRTKPAKGENKRTLLDLTVTTVFDNGLSSQFRQVVFQPLVDSAAALSRQYAFQYQADRQRVQLRGAKVYRTDGSVDEAIETGVGAANDPSIAMYTSARTYYVQFPRLEPGDVVELQYRVDDVASRNEFADYFGDIQYLQNNESIGHAEYVLITPKARRMYIDHRGIPGLKSATKTTEKQKIYRFWADNLDPVLPEPAMPPWAEVLGFVHVSTYANYDELGKWYWGLAQDQFDLDDETRKLAREITKDLKTEKEKVAAVYNWVIQNTRYVALEFGIYGFKPRRCVQTVNRGWGDCKDKATVIVSLLKELGIESTIVIIRTQMRGRFSSKVASLAPFDHAIAYVPSLDLYLDGTAEFTGSTEMPAMDQESLAILVNQGKPKLVTTPLSDPTSNLRRRHVSAKLAADGSAQLKLDYLTTGTHAPSWRARYTAEATRRERLTQDLGREFPGAELLPGAAGAKVEVSDFEKPVTMALHAKAPNFARQEGEKLTVPVTTRIRLTDEYASLSKRKLDVRVPVFGVKEDVFELQLPAGTAVHSGPVNVDKQTEFGDFSVKIEHQPGKVLVTSRLLLKQTHISPKQYAAWRAFCEEVDAAMTPRLVIGPKTR